MNPNAFAASWSVPATLFAFDRAGGMWLADATWLRRFDLLTGRVARHAQPLGLDAPLALAVAPDGTQVVLCDRDRSVHLREPLDPLRATRADLYVTGVADVAFSPDGKRLAMAHGEEGVLLVETSTMEPRWAAEFIASQQPILRFSTDGTRLAVNTCEAVVSFAVDDGHQLARLEPRDEALFTWSASSDLDSCDLAVDCGARLLRAANTTDSSHEPRTFEPLPSTTTRAVALVREPAGTVLAATADGTIARIGADSPQLLTRIEPTDGQTPTPIRLELSPDGRHLASRWTDDNVRLFRLPT